MKKLKLIIGATLFPNVAALELPIVATIGINFDGNLDQEIIKMIGEQSFVVEPSPSVGEYDLCALVFTRSISELDKIAYAIRERFAARTVAINVWSGPPYMNFQNIDLKPEER
jgi:DNA-binding Lrp family transcriptional regulator